MMAASCQYLTVGKFGKPFGLKGWLKVYSYTDPSEQLLHYKPWHIRQPHGSKSQDKVPTVWQKITVIDAKMQGKIFIAQLAGCLSPQQSKKYTNQSIAIHRAQLPALTSGQYYWLELEGLTVINQQGETLGCVDHLIAGASHDVLVVKGSKEYLIPYIKEQFVVEINLAQEKLIVDWPKDF